MLFKKLDIHLYRPDSGLSRFFALRLWYFAVLPCLVFMAAGVFACLWPYAAKYSQLERKYRQEIKLLAAQRAEIFELCDDYEQLGRELARIVSFNAKLTVMTSDKPLGSEITSQTREPQFVLKDSLGLYRQSLLMRRMHALARYAVPESARQEAMQQELAFVMRQKWSRLAAMPSIWPTTGELASDFGYRRGHFHKGIDITTHIGTPVRVTADGEVNSVGYDGAYGLMVVIDHKYGLQTAYAHLKSANVSEGQKVGRGELIAHSGNSGRSTGPHLHYEVRVSGSPVDPVNYLLD